MSEISNHLLTKIEKPAKCGKVPKLADRAKAMAGGVGIIKMTRPSKSIRPGWLVAI
jgi:hypothetical protein